ncbi:MAG: hypothetical protein IJB79_06310 [Candidatus Gastranaerophilales bacterium]|nr:hypothetical protein [Candidatus Gastranaerophilales bacterium]
MKISETTINCCKPNRYLSFTAENSDKPSKKVRYKHYEQMSDDVLSLKSVLKAHKEVQQSGKMRLFKALPEITTALIGTTIALTQPGKLAAKAGAGLGFLAFTKILSAGVDKITQPPEKGGKSDPKKALIESAKIAAGLGAVALGVVSMKNTKASKFLAKEASQLTSEINNTKLGKFVENTFNPFLNKHSKTAEAINLVAPFGIIATSALTQVNLADSLSKDIKEKATQNFVKGKLIQAQARAHFDSIDAQEV